MRRSFKASHHERRRYVDDDISLDNMVEGSSESGCRQRPAFASVIFLPIESRETRGGSGRPVIATPEWNNSGT